MIRRSPLESNINHERWLVSYADFITLLFAFFVVMYSVSHVNLEKYEALSTTLESAFSSQGNAEDSARTLATSEKVQVADLETLSQELTESLAGVLTAGDVTFTGNEQWLELGLPSSLLFSSGEADIRREARELLASVADILDDSENAIAIEGHTDDVPIGGVAFASNWDLSASRAVAVVNTLAFEGIQPWRMSAVGHGEYRPIADNTTSEGREKNRRVVLRIAREAVALPAVEVATLEQGGEQKRPPLEESDNLLTPADDPLPESPVAPVRLEKGGLLFSRDPNLPRTNPPIQTVEPLPTEG